MTRKKLSKPPAFTDVMQESFGRATREAAARAEMAGVAAVGAPKAKTPAKKGVVVGMRSGRSAARKKG